METQLKPTLAKQGGRTFLEGLESLSILGTAVVRI